MLVLVVDWLFSSKKSGHELRSTSFQILHGVYIDMYEELSHNYHIIYFYTR